MPLLRNGRLTDGNGWIHLADDEPLPDTPEDGASPVPVTLGLERFLAHVAGGGQGVAGVRLTPADDALALAPWLDRLQLVEIDFPAYTDGRGYSHARRLRTRLGFGGEIRAVGDVRPDQILFMMRAGIDAFAFASAPDEALLSGVLSRYRTSYQPSYALAIAG